MPELTRAVLGNLLITLPLAALLLLLGQTRWLWQRPALRHGLWWLLLIKLVTPPLVGLPLPPAEEDPQAAWRQLVAESGGDLVTPAAPGNPPPVPVDLPAPSAAVVTSDWSGRLLPGLIALSLTVTLLLWLRAARGLARVAKMLSLLPGEEPSREARLLAEVAGRFGLKTTPAVRVVSEHVSPLLWSLPLARPVIVLPGRFVDTLDDDALRQVLGHELSHSVRRDPLTNVVAYLVTTLCWWNPLAWLAYRQLRGAAEACCDALTLHRLGGSRKTYAKTLLAAVEFVAAAETLPPALLTSFGASQSLRRRIEMIANVRVSPRMPVLGWLLIAAGLVGLAVWPVQADPPLHQSETRPADSGVDPADPQTGNRPAKPTVDPADPKTPQEIEQIQQRLQGLGRYQNVPITFQDDQPLEVSGWEVIRVFQTNEARAEKLLLDKRVRVSGAMNSIQRVKDGETEGYLLKMNLVHSSPSMPKKGMPGAGSPYSGEGSEYAPSALPGMMSPYGSPGFSSIQLYFYFPLSERDQLAELQPGQGIVVEGDCQGPQRGELREIRLITFRNCSLPAVTAESGDEVEQQRQQYRKQLDDTGKAWELELKGALPGAPPRQDK